MADKMRRIMDNSKHFLYATLAKQRSFFSNRLQQLCCNKERHKKEFLLTAIRLYNEPTMRLGSYVDTEDNGHVY